MVAKYQPITLPPTLPNFCKGNDAAPPTSEKNTIGTTIIFNMLMNTVPKGEA